MDQVWALRTFHSFLTFLFQPASTNQLCWVHPSKMFRRLQANTSVGTSNNDRLAREVGCKDWELHVTI